MDTKKLDLGESKPKAQAPDTNHYRCTLIPADLLPEQVEPAASSKTLPFCLIQAINADDARGRAYRATGMAVHDVERIEYPQEVAA